RCITGNIVLIIKIWRDDLIIPNFKEFKTIIENGYNKAKELKGGKVATYIPQLSRASPDYWGVSICTIDGQRYNLGDYDVPFCMQSCSKCISYAVALNDLSSDFVHQFVGYEPSGAVFNELTLNEQDQPHSPMINSGAIMVAALHKPDQHLSDRFEYIIKQFKKAAGGEYVGFDNATYISEKETADRNYALAYYMREKKAFPPNTVLEDTMNLYFQLCSTEIDCCSGAVMAATLANGGICPITGEKTFSPIAVRDTLSQMFSCGMYNYSGQFAFKVIGLPAKSGVSGAILIVIPNVMGICVWSPPLDKQGNSVRGLEFCNSLVEHCRFHRFDSLLKHSQTKFDPTNRFNDDNTGTLTAIQYAASRGDLTALRRYFLNGYRLDIPDYDGRTALHLAAIGGHVAAVRFLVEKCDVPINYTDRWGNTPLDDAKKFNRQQVIDILNKFLDSASNFPR
ncbi:uncharacterized protein TRIADDRAFT_32107, partial [Trichoplax adhaerens]